MLGTKKPAAARASLSIRSRLIQAQLLGTSLVLAACSISYTLNDVFILKRSIDRDLESTSRILERGLLPALAFSDKPEASKILSSVEAERTISAMALFGSNGELFAQFGQPSSAVVRAHQKDVHMESQLRDGHLIFHHPLVQNGETLGDLYLDADIRAFAAEYRNHLWILTLVFFVGFLLSYLLARFLQQSLSKPITELALMAKTISQDGVYSLRMKPAQSGHRIDEIEILSAEINQMLDQIQAKDDKILAANIELEMRIEERTTELKESQRSALKNAHAAGMAEIATGVLHNIGNITNSVNASTEEILQVVRKSRTEGLIKGIQLLKEHQHELARFLGEDPRGKVLTEYLIQAGGAVIEEHARLKEEAGSVLKKISLIKDVIHTQQDYAKQGLFAESHSLAQVMTEIIDLQIDALNKQGVAVVKQFDETVVAKIQKVKFAHILMNLIKNAKEAMEGCESDRKVLSIEIGRNPTGDVFLKISDTGHGISSDSLEKIFNHGFTTKTAGHGFGLHFCANAMTEMDGKMTVESAGLGKGASFTLSFPNPTRLEHPKSA